MFYIKVCVGNILYKMLAHNIKTFLFGQLKHKNVLGKVSKTPRGGRVPQICSRRPQNPDPP